MVEAYDRLAALGYLAGAARWFLSPSGATARRASTRLAVTELAVDAHWLSRNVAHQTDAGALQARLRLVSARLV